MHYSIDINVQIDEASDVSTLRTVAMEAIDLIIDSGFSKPIVQLTESDKSELIHVLALNCTLVRCKAEIDQMLDGLKALEVASLIKQHPALLRLFFTPEGLQPLTPGIVNNTIKGY